MAFSTLNRITNSGGGTKLMCFSPPVMAATFAIEFSLAIFLLLRRWSMTVLLSAAVLICLGLFQFAEFAICGPGWHTDRFPAIGFASITILPMLGLWIVYSMTRTRKLFWIAAVYSIWCSWYVGNFLFNSNLVIDFECRANYVYFDLIGNSASGYLTYYYVGLIAGVVGSLWTASHHAAFRRGGRQLAFGYLSFMIPVTLVTMIFTDTLKSTPSIMCGFAVIFAVHLARVIVPAIEKGREEYLGDSKKTFKRVSKTNKKAAAKKSKTKKKSTK